MGRCPGTRLFCQNKYQGSQWRAGGRDNECHGSNVTRSVQNTNYVQQYVRTIKNITDCPERGLYWNHRACVRCKSISAMKSSCTRSESSIRQKASWGDMEGRAEPFSEVRGGRNPRKAGGFGVLRGGRPLFPSRARIFSIFPQWPKSQDMVECLNYQ